MAIHKDIQANDGVVIRIEGISKHYQMGETIVRALDGVDLSVKTGEMLSIMGASGSGKSTLMAILGCLDKPTNGRYCLDGSYVESMSDAQLAEIRGNKIGFVFQQFNLLARTSALENVMLPLTYAGVGGRQKTDQAKEALDLVGLSDRVHHSPSELSGGQQQLVAIARALVNRPAILLAHEPPGPLDSKTGAALMDLFQKLHNEQGITLCIVTHDSKVAALMPRSVILHDGRISGDESK